MLLFVYLLPLSPPFLSYGSPVFLRAFKAGGRRNIDALTTQRGYNIGQDESGSTIEIWVQHGATYKLYKSFPVCAYSGVLGTKTRQGDGQTPEGYLHFVFAIFPPFLDVISDFFLCFVTRVSNRLSGVF